MSLESLKQQLFNNLANRLSAGIVDLEIDPAHYETAFNYAVQIYRQRAQQATEETYTLLSMIEHVDTYTLPNEYINVRALFKRTIGLDTGAGASSFDPFSSAIMNTYLLNYNTAGGLTTYELYAGYIKLAARMFGGYITYTFNPVTKQLRISRDVKASGEKILVWADMLKSEEVLIQDNSSGPWISDFTLAELKMIIGGAREKFGSVVGPGSGTTLNGTAMKADGAAMQERLFKDLRDNQVGNVPLTWIIG